MSLLEDVFLQDEAGEAQELERIIEGDEYDERPRGSSPDSNDNSEKEDEAEEDKRKVDPPSTKPKRVVKNPRVILNPARLTGPRGIQIIPEHFKDFKFKGKGHEKEDLDLVLKKLEHWAYRLFPKFEFKDCLKKIETLGNKRPVMVHLTKIRSDQYMSEETVIQRDSSDDEAPVPVQEEDEFDKLLQQQIDLARATPAPGSVRKPAFSTPMVDKSLMMPKAKSSPSINEEQRERMLRNKQLAEERRLARLKLNNSETSNTQQTTDLTRDSDVNNDTTKDLIKNSDVNNDITKDLSFSNREEQINNDTEETIDEEIRPNNNRSQIIDSSDDDDALVINESIVVDVHDSKRLNDYEKNPDSDQKNSNSDEGIRPENDVDMIGIDEEIMLRNNERDKNDVSLDNTTEYDERFNEISDENERDVSSTSKVHADNINEKLNETHSQSIVVKSNDINIHTEVLKKDLIVIDDNQVENKRDESEQTDEQIVLDSDLQEIMDVDFSDDF